MAMRFHRRLCSRVRNDQQFPLRLLPPYASTGEDAFEQFEKLLFEAYPRWAPPRD